MKISYRNLDKLYMGLDACNNLSGPKFVYAIAKNIAKIDVELKFLEKAIKPSDAFLKYEKERIQLCEDNCVKDPSGKPIMENREYAFPGNIDKDKLFDDLMATHKEALDERQKQIDEFNKLMDSEVEIDLHMLKPEALPENITVLQLKGIDFIVE